MKYDDIDKAAELRQSLSKINNKINGLWSLPIDPVIRERFGPILANRANEAVVETLRVHLVRERNDVIQKLNTMGVTFTEEEQ